MLNLYQSELEKEKRAKNQAYLFIIKCGLFPLFYRFCMQNRSDDYHKDCVESLKEQYL